MTREEAIENLKILKEDYWDDDGYGHETKQYDDTMCALDMAISTLEQEPCENVINREKLDKALYEHFHEEDGPNNITEVRLGAVRNFIKDFPSVTPTHKKGKWIYDYTSTDGHKTYHCSECGCYLQPKHSEPLDSFKWCSLCGAEMESEE